MRYDTIIIGAGAAGLYAALHAGKRGRKAFVLEHNADPGAKILISGGGRCNFTNLNAGDPARYISANPHFARSALSRHPPHAFIELLTKHRIAHYEKTLGQLFCEGARSSRKIVAMLLAECQAGGVEVSTGTHITGVRRNDRFVVETSRGAFESETLAIAAGGLSIPKLGASGLAFDIARQFDVSVVPTRPGLVPLTFAESDITWMRPLSGVSADVIARCGKAAFREAALFTHRGLSGPAILQVSSYWRAGEDVVIDWLPDATEDIFVRRKRERPKAQLKTALSEVLPERLAQAIVQLYTRPLSLEGRGAGVGVNSADIAKLERAPPGAHPDNLTTKRRMRAGRRALQPSSGAHSHHPLSPPPLGEGDQISAIGGLKDSTLLDIARALKSFAVAPTGTEGYAKAEVMIGGVDTDALSQQTMECRAVPGLFFIGECVDVTGWLGGYNFQWAWSSGWAAGQAL